MAGHAARRNATQLAFGRYEHLGELGAGGSGRVVEVRDHEAGGVLKALKIVDEAQAERLSWELAVLTSTSHPSLAQVHELLRVDVALPAPFRIPRGAFVLVEERAPGAASDVTMAALEPAARVAAVRSAGAKVAGALAALHARGLVHGDVKPANVVVALSPEPRATLVDLGLSGAFGRGTPRGTPRYLAPEGFLGERNAQTDLFALGATLADWLQPHASTEGSRSDSAGGSLPIPRRAPLPASVPRELAALVEACLAESPEERPRSAREVARRLGEAPDVLSLLEATTPAERARRALVLPLVGRAREVATLAHAIEKSLRERRAILVAIRGPRGSGRTRVATEAVRRAQHELSAAGDAPPTLRELRALESTLPREPTVLHFTHEPSTDASIEPVHARVLRDAARVVDVPLVLLMETSAADAGGDANDVEITVGPLAQAPFVSLLHALLDADRTDAALVDAYRRATGGLPGRLVRAFATRWSANEDPRTGPPQQGSHAEDLSALGSPAHELALGAALADDRIDRATAQRLVGTKLDQAAGLLVARGLAEHDESGRLAVREDVAADLRARATAEERRRIGALLVAGLGRGPGHALALAASGATRESIRELLDAAGVLRDHALPERAASLLRRGLEALPEPTPEHELLAIALADAELAAGRTDAALHALPRPTSEAGQILRAEIHRQRGELAEATEQLDALVMPPGAHLRVSAMRSRIALARGDLTQGGEPPETPQPDASWLFAVETAALVALTRGDADHARTLTERGLLAVERATTLPIHERAHRRARLSAVLASAHAALGDPRAALTAFEASVDAIGRAGQRHAAASFLVNLGIGRIDLGLLGPALVALREGAERLALLGRARDLARALYNLANAAMLAGDRARARQMADRASLDATSTGDADARVLAAVLLAEADVGDGRPRAGERRLVALLARETASSGEGGSLTSLVRARLATVRSLVFDLEGAEAALGPAPDASEALSTRVEWDLARARVWAAHGETATARARAEATLAKLGARGSFELRCRALTLTAETCDADGDLVASRRHMAALRSVLDPALATLEAGERARFRAVHARALASAPESAAATKGDAERVLAHARGLLAEVSRRRIGERLVRGARDLSGAEHAFIVARERDGSLTVRAGEGPNGPVAAPESHLSLSVVARCLDGGLPVLSRDAGADLALEGGASIAALSVRSVLALPLEGTPLPSALYLDDRLRPAAFGEDALARVKELAALASIAFENVARLRRERQRHLLAARRERGLRASLREKTEQTALLARERPEAFRLVAEAPAMKELVSLATRIAASDIPLLVTGESGTGKEVIAQFVHRVGARASRPFVAENCAAIPEALLESTLFGHARGAFSGAVEARRGLFEAADGGTLLLDEVGEMSLAMQAKLLRALSTGEIRPVGSERTRKVDVRVIAATHADLRAMIARGTFREDLFYRLAVVELVVPPLRDRLEDITPLVRRFVTDERGEATPIEPTALRALLAHRWPGNVRELGSEVRRALALDPSALRLANLSPALRGDGEVRSDDLDLKAAVGDLERRLVGRALAQSGQNVTQAAKALGLSRFGLQKMLARLRAEPDRQPK